MSSFRALGWLLLALGTCVAGYALFVFDASVSTAMGSVNNMGLLQGKQNLMFAGGVMAIVGVLVALLGPQEPATMSSKGEDAIDPRRVFAIAVRDNDLPRINEMLERGDVDPNGSLGEKSESWLTLAADGPRPYVVEILLRRGADPKAVDGTGFSPLQHMINRTPEPGTSERSVLDLMRNPPKVEPITRTPQVEDLRARGKQQDDLTDGREKFAYQLIELGKMRESGLLTAREFEAAKARLLAT